ncbi:MAG: DUF2500 domain-containing protein [Clostridia bacterium]|nr:DUF2500 domain-containing protein [Clostridia bacterium]
MGFMGFGGFEVIFFLMFFLFFAFFIIQMIRGIAEWGKNNDSPELTVSAKVVTKRSHRSHHHHSNGHHHTSSTYYVTFEFESGDRMELRVSGSEYGMIAEGDMGRLTFKGTRYLSFERTY